eukprot:gene14699-16290_t
MEYIGGKWFENAVLDSRNRHRELGGLQGDTVVIYAERLGGALAMLMAWTREWNVRAGNYVPLICESEGDDAASDAEQASPGAPDARRRHAQHAAEKYDVVIYLKAYLESVPLRLRMALLECLPLRAEDLAAAACRFQWRHKRWFVSACELTPDAEPPACVVSGVMKENDAIRALTRRAHRDPSLWPRIGTAALLAPPEAAIPDPTIIPLEEWVKGEECTGALIRQY